MEWWFWVLVAFLLLTIEFFATTAHVGFFAVGAFLVAILVGVGLVIPLWAQLLIFAISSVVLLVFVRPIVVLKLGLSKTHIVDTLVGEQAIVMTDLAVGDEGKAEMRGSTWTARNIGETPLLKGQRCVVEKVSGLTIHVRAS
ncbi:MAG: inner membrane protein [Thermoanaerobaculia bacterium]|jgi:membrane protein implicated in regulation of membrane protease activity|nr:inner membrane protein [Thermoanaerobaculia bacterium]